MTNEEKELFEALMYAGVPELPPKARNGQIWIFAIAKVRTRTMQTSYAILRNRLTLVSVVKTFGQGGVAKILSVHPYEMLEDKYRIRLPLKEAVEHVANYYGKTKEEVAALPKDSLERLLLNEAMQAQIADKRKPE